MCRRGLLRRVFIRVRRTDVVVDGSGSAFGIDMVWQWDRIVGLASPPNHWIDEMKVKVESF